MKKYTVTFRKTEETSVEICASSQDEAEEMAWEMFMDCEVVFPPYFNFENIETEVKIAE